MGYLLADAELALACMLMIDFLAVMSPCQRYAKGHVQSGWQCNLGRLVHTTCSRQRHCCSFRLKDASLQHKERRRMLASSNMSWAQLQGCPSVRRVCMILQAPELSTAPNVSNNVTNDYSMSVPVGDLSPWRHLYTSSSCEQLCSGNAKPPFLGSTALSACGLCINTSRSLDHRQIHRIASSLQTQCKRKAALSLPLR